MSEIRKTYNNIFLRYDPHITLNSGFSTLVFQLWFFNSGFSTLVFQLWFRCSEHPFSTYQYLPPLLNLSSFSFPDLGIALNHACILSLN
jgi:hypothetical protein